MSPPIDTHIGLAHGNGGQRMRELIESVFAPVLGNPLLDVAADAVPVPSEGAEWMVTTDGFTVQPLEFPGGDIGCLAVHGTINDLAVSGAIPRYLTLNAFLEEGLEIALLRRVVESLGRAARECGVVVIAGDTKVLPRGQCDGIYLATTGLGIRGDGARPRMDLVRPGDKLLVSGSIGDHGAAVMLAREEFGMRGALRSDTASVLPQARALAAIPGLRFMRDPTRGGIATVLHEIARASGFGLVLDEASVPLSDAVQSVCELLGFDPLYLACEGRLLAVVDPTDSDAALAALRQLSPDAALVGEVSDRTSLVTLRTTLGGERLLDELEDSPLPRIC